MLPLFLSRYHMSRQSLIDPARGSRADTSAHNQLTCSLHIQLPFYKDFVQSNVPKNCVKIRARKLSVERSTRPKRPKRPNLEVVFCENFRALSVLSCITHNFTFLQNTTATLMLTSLANGILILGGINERVILASNAMCSMYDVNTSEWDKGVS